MKHRIPGGIWLLAAILAAALVAYACGGSSAPDGPTPVPTPAPTPNFPAIMAAGDISCDSATPQLPCRARATSDLILSEKALRSVVVALPLGDTQYDSGTLAEFNKNYDATWGRVNSFAHPAVGNHEYETRGAAGYFDYFASKGVGVGARTEGWYQFTVGEWHFISLNSNCGQIGGCNVGSAQYRWLQTDLATNRSKCTVAYMHHPFQSSGQNGGTPELLPFMRLLYENNVEIVLAGHDHDYERFNPITPDLVSDTGRGMRLFVVGTGGRDLQGFARPGFAHLAFRNNDHFGVLRIVMKDLAYDWDWINTEGVSLDKGSGVCF